MKKINKELKETLKKELQLGKHCGIYGDIDIKLKNDGLLISSSPKLDTGSVINEIVTVALLDFLEYNKDMLDIEIDSLDITLKLFEEIIKNSKRGENNE